MATSKQLSDLQSIRAALSSAEKPALLLVERDCQEPEVLDLLALAKKFEIPVRQESENDLRRMSQTDPPARLLALIDRNPQASLDEVLTSRDPLWLLVGTAYASNVGFAIRTVEVAGAGGIIIDSHFEPRERAQALRVSMRADRFMPVFWENAEEVITRAREAGRQIIGMEDVGTLAPWEANLAEPCLLIVGGERHGIPESLLNACDQIIRIPMAGFIPSYNLQVAVSAISVERLRQVENFGS